MPSFGDVSMIEPEGEAIDASSSSAGKLTKPLPITEAVEEKKESKKPYAPGEKEASKMPEEVVSTSITEPLGMDSSFSEIGDITSLKPKKEKGEEGFSGGSGSSSYYEPDSMAEADGYGDFIRTGGDTSMLSGMGGPSRGAPIRDPRMEPAYALLDKVYRDRMNMERENLFKRARENGRVMFNVGQPEFGKGGKYEGMQGALLAGGDPFLHTAPGEGMGDESEKEKMPQDPLAMDYREQPRKKRKVMQSLAHDQYGTYIPASGTKSVAGAKETSHEAMLQSVSSGASSSAVPGNKGWTYGGPYNYPEEVSNPEFLKVVNGYDKIKGGARAGSSVWKTTHTKQGKPSKRKRYFKYSNKKKKWRQVTRDYKNKWTKKKRDLKDVSGTVWPAFMKQMSMMHALSLGGGEAAKPAVPVFGGGGIVMGGGGGSKAVM